ncbi:MAG: ABC transporter permease [Christensenellaceae bacterium]
MDIKQAYRKNSEVFIVYAVLVVVLIVGGVSSEYFMTLPNMGNILEQATALGIVSIGHMLVIMLAGIDLSTGAIVSMSTAILSVTFVDSPWGILIGILIVLGVSFGIGLFNGIGVTKLRLPPFIMTLATLSIVNGIALKVRPSPGGSVPLEFMEFLNGRFGIVPHAIILWAVIAVVVWYVLKYKRFGRDIYAVGGNENAAELSGISVQKTKIKAYILCSMLAGVGGIYLSARMGTGDTSLGKMFGTDSITVCVLGGVSMSGGRGNIIGLFAATFVLCMLSNILNMVGVASYYQYLLKGIILIVTVLIFSLKDMRNKERTF